MSNIYEQCPVLENERWLMRFVKEEDADDLLLVYGDKQALPFFTAITVMAYFSLTVDKQTFCFV